MMVRPSSNVVLLVRSGAVLLQQSDGGNPVAPGQLTLTSTLTLTFTRTLTSTLTRLARGSSPTLKDSPNNSFTGGSFNQGTGSFHPPPAFVAKPPRVSIFRSGKSDLSQGAPVQVVEWSALVGQRFLGSGEFCSVWGAELDGKRVAVKVPSSSSK